MSQGTCLLCELEADPSGSGEPVFENAHWIAGRFPGISSPGSLALRTRRHNEGIWDLNADEAASFGAVLTAMSSAIRTACGAAKVYVLSLGENHPHFHALVVPRLDDDDSGLRALPLLQACLDDENPLAQVGPPEEIAQSIRELMAKDSASGASYA